MPLEPFFYETEYISEKLSKSSNLNVEKSLYICEGGFIKVNRGTVKFCERIIEVPRSWCEFIHEISYFSYLWWDYVRIDDIIWNFAFKFISHLKYLVLKSKICK